MSKKVVAVLGTYRKKHLIDNFVDQILGDLESRGAKTSKIYLIDEHIEFCTNCRLCTQEPGPKRGKCIHNDAMEKILQQIDAADAIILASPVNFSNMTAVTRRFMERLIPYAYWPWGGFSPKTRVKYTGKKALLITACGAPRFFIYLIPGAMKALKIAADVMGAKPVGSTCIGLASLVENPVLSASLIKRAKRLALKI